jgi:hypothetical protein
MHNMDLPGGNSEFDSAYYEDQIRKNFQDKQTVTVFKYPLNVTSIIVPKTHGLPKRKLGFVDIKHKDKALLYRLIVAAYNYAFTDEFAALSTKGNFSRHCWIFVDWLNGVEISNRYSALKDYESYCFVKRNNHGGASELVNLKTLFTYAYEDDEFRKSLTQEESSYLIELKKTKVSPNLNKKQSSITSYFGALDWLRREDVGVGNQLYQTLASPKLVVKSLKCTASVVITELYKAKTILRHFLLHSSLSACDFEIPNFQSKSRHERPVFIGKIIYTLLCKYHEMEEKSAHLRKALELVLLSNVTTQTCFDKIRPAIDSKDEMEFIFRTKEGLLSNWVLGRTFKNANAGILLSVGALQQLADTTKPFPITQLEELFFSWLMASLTVQPSDISKLSKHSFRLLKIGGRVTHIECEYFKGRANAIHNTRTLSTRKIEGRALLLYLNQHSGISLCSYEAETPIIASGFSSICGVLNVVLSLPFMLDQLASKHRQIGRNPVIMPLVLNSLITHGLHNENIIKASRKLTVDERRARVWQSETPCSKALFGFRAIKNSAVHAFSDPYTLYYLINRNSHTNQTEKLNYLTADNEEWMNSSGRITRSVMLDLINNVFDLDFRGLSDKQVDKAKAAFNYEFGSVTDTVSHKSGEMLSRLKVVTEQGKGLVNEIGVLSLANRGEDAFDPIYVLDSQVTVFKILNYLDQFKNNYKRLLSRNPDYLYQTVLPNVEWMERVLTKLSKKSITSGEKTFEQMQKENVSISVFHSL